MISNSDSKLPIKLPETEKRNYRIGARFTDSQFDQLMKLARKRGEAVQHTVEVIVITYLKTASESGEI